MALVSQYLHVTTWMTNSLGSALVNDLFSIHLIKEDENNFAFLFLRTGWGQNNYAKKTVAIEKHVSWKGEKKKKIHLL